jgi:hypothetical protein
MPSFSHLDPKDLQDVIAFILEKPSPKSHGKKEKIVLVPCRANRDKGTHLVIPIINKHIDQIIERKNSSKLAEHKEVYSYLQLTWGICAVTQLNWDGEFIYCYEIFMKSVFDKSFQNGETYDLNDIKILNFINSKNDYISKSKSVINQWFSQLYYYSKSFSGLNEWCEFYFDDIYYDLNENLIVEFPLAH